jgi:hypothetical protein
VLKLLGIVALVALILVGALMPLRYTSNLQLPKVPPPSKRGEGASSPDGAGLDD